MNEVVPPTIGSCLEAKRPAVHFSIDDVIVSLAELFTTEPQSIYDVPFFRSLRDIHKESGAVVTCYLFHESAGARGARYAFDLSMASGRYRREFKEASSWLVFGIHARRRLIPMTCERSQDLAVLIGNMSAAIARFSGQPHIPDAWRPHYFVADRDACDLMRDRGVRTLLTPDDDRKIAACLHPDVVELMRKCYLHEDPVSGFRLVRSLFRLEDPSFDLAAMEREMEASVAEAGVAAVYTHEHEFGEAPRNPHVPEWANALMNVAKSRGWTFTA